MSAWQLRFPEGAARDLKPDRVLSVRFGMVEKRYALAAWLPEGAGTDLKPDRVLSVRFEMVEKKGMAWQPGCPKAPRGI